MAPSSLESARVRLSAPVCSVLIIAFVKSWRICTVDRFEPNVCDCDRNVASAAVSSVCAAWMLAFVAQLPAAAAIARALAVVSVTPVTVMLEVAVSLSVMVKLSPLSKLVPLKPASVAS